MLAFNQVILKKEVMGPLASGVLSSIDTWELLGGARSLALQVRASKASGSDTLLIQFETSNDGVNWFTSALPSLAVAAGVTSQAMRTVTSVNGRMARLRFGWSGGSGEGTLWVSATGRISRGAASRAQKAPARPLMAPLTKGALAALPGTTANMIRAAPKAGLDAKECGAGCACAPCDGVRPTAAGGRIAFRGASSAGLLPFEPALSYFEPDISRARTISLEAGCRIEWTPLEYDALEAARRCLWARNWPQATFGTCVCAAFEVDPQEGTVPTTCYGDPRSAGLSIDEIIFQRLTAILTAMGADGGTREPVRWGAVSALATMRAYIGGLGAVHDYLFLQTGHEAVTITGCHVPHADSRDGTILLPARVPFTRCVDPDPGTQPSPGPPFGPLPSWVVPIDVLAEQHARIGIPAHLPSGLLGVVDPDPMRIDAIMDAKSRAVRALDRAGQRLRNMSAAEQVAYLQCQFDDPLTLPFVFTASDVPTVLARMTEARTALNTAAVGPAFASHIEFLPFGVSGQIVFPAEFAAWARDISAAVPKAITVGWRDRMDASTELDPSRWWSGVTQLWLALDVSARAAVLVHEAFHLSNHSILDSSPDLLNPYYYESLVVDLAELHRIDEVRDRHCDARPGDTRSYTCA